MEGIGTEDHHDWYADRPAMVHLRLGQGLLPSAPPTTAGDARVSETQTQRSIITAEL